MIEREDQYRFQLCGAGYNDDDIVIACGTCNSWDAKLDAWTNLADLIDRAQEHAEVCR